MLVHPDWRGHGIGRQMMQAMQTIYGNFHQQQLSADGEAVGFYESLGFEIADSTEPRCIYQGDEH